jgi:predicted RNase H-related nuclease YkuK (DUF458 family)
MFRSARGVEMTMEEIIAKVAKYIADQPSAHYEFTVGTDSQNHSRTKMVEVIAVHRQGNGGTYFYNIEYVRKIDNLKQKISTETLRSLYIANGLLDKLEISLYEYDIDIDDLDISFQIHCDIGNDGKTSMLINEITKWVTSCGYVCLIKPYSYAASGIADRYSK